VWLRDRWPAIPRLAAVLAGAVWFATAGRQSRTWLLCWPGESGWARHWDAFYAATSGRPRTARGYFRRALCVGLGGSHEICDVEEPETLHAVMPGCFAAHDRGLVESVRSGD